VIQGCAQDGLDPLRKNLNRSESEAQNFFGGGPDPPGWSDLLLFCRYKTSHKAVDKIQKNSVNMHLQHA